MDKDFYKDLEKIKTIGSTYMAAVGLAPTAGAKVGAGCQACPLGDWVPALPQLPTDHGQAPRLGPRLALCIGLGQLPAGCLVRGWLFLDTTFRGKSTPKAGLRDILPPCPLPTSPTPIQAAWHH